MQDTPIETWSLLSSFLSSSFCFAASHCKQPELSGKKNPIKPRFSRKRQNNSYRARSFSSSFSLFSQSLFSQSLSSLSCLLYPAKPPFWHLRNAKPLSRLSTSEKKKLLARWKSDTNTHHKCAKRTTDSRDLQEKQTKRNRVKILTSLKFQKNL